MSTRFTAPRLTYQLSIGLAQKLGQVLEDGLVFLAAHVELMNGLFDITIAGIIRVQHLIEQLHCLLHLAQHKAMLGEQIVPSCLLRHAILQQQVGPLKVLRILALDQLSEHRLVYGAKDTLTLRHRRCCLAMFDVALFAQHLVRIADFLQLWKLRCPQQQALHDALLHRQRRLGA